MQSVGPKLGQRQSVLWTRLERAANAFIFSMASDASFSIQAVSSLARERVALSRSRALDFGGDLSVSFSIYISSCLQCVVCLILLFICLHISKINFPGICAYSCGNQVGSPLA